jgi:hypothetical protein
MPSYENWCVRCRKDGSDKTLIMMEKEETAGYIESVWDTF